MDIAILQEAGLSTTEAKVYLALLELGSALAGEITKKAEINRTNVYDALERLITKGLVTHVITANRKVFEPIAPERLGEILQEKQDKIKSFLPQLNELYKASKVKEDATLFKGKKGIKSLYEEFLKDGKEFYVYGAESRFTDMFPAYQKDWNERRAKLGINMKIIFSERVREIKRSQKFKKCQMHFLPKQYEFPSTILIGKNIVATVVWTEVPFGFLVKSKEAVKGHMTFFEILWKVAQS